MPSLSRLEGASVGVNVNVAHRPLDADAAVRRAPGVGVQDIHKLGIISGQGVLVICMLKNKRPLAGDFLPAHMRLNEMGCRPAEHKLFTSKEESLTTFLTGELVHRSPQHPAANTKSPCLAVLSKEAPGGSTCGGLSVKCLFWDVLSVPNLFGVSLNNILVALHISRGGFLRHTVFPSGGGSLLFFRARLLALVVLFLGLQINDSQLRQFANFRALRNLHYPSVDDHDVGELCSKAKLNCHATVKLQVKALRQWSRKSREQERSASRASKVRPGLPAALSTWREQLVSSGSLQRNSGCLDIASASCLHPQVELSSIFANLFRTSSLRVPMLIFHSSIFSFVSPNKPRELPDKRGTLNYQNADRWQHKCARGW
ncbi:hypothetical protein INR49_019612 [Caranx melampygus]|nr:hypothetical protein INR49_019612 [Caranx melampygus]